MMKKVLLLGCECGRLLEKVFVSDIAVFVLKRDVKLHLTNYRNLLEEVKSEVGKTGCGVMRKSLCGNDTVPISVCRGRGMRCADNQRHTRSLYTSDG